MNLRTSTLLLVATLSFAGAPRIARAQPPTPASVEEARSHYKRGVDLHGEGNYTAALIEFRRAYEIAPSFTVLYNIGQTHYQLHDYAASLKTFQAYLQEGGATIPPARRAEVEQQVKYLRDRVGFIELKSNVEGADVMIDGVPSGKTPLSQPLGVSVGRRRVELIKNDRVLGMRQVDVAAGDRTKVELNEATTAVAVPTPAEAGQARTGAEGQTQTALPPDAPSQSGSAAPVVAWVTTGALAVGTTIVGILAVSAASDLKTKRETDGITRDDLLGAQSKTKTLGVVADVLGIATVLAAGTATYFTIASSSKERAKGTGVHVDVGLGQLMVRGRF